MKIIQKLKSINDQIKMYEELKNEKVIIIEYPLYQVRYELHGDEVIADYTNNSNVTVTNGYSLSQHLKELYEIKSFTESIEKIMNQFNIAVGNLSDYETLYSTRDVYDQFQVSDILFRHISEKNVEFVYYDGNSIIHELIHPDEVSCDFHRIELSTGDLYEYFGYLYNLKNRVTSREGLTHNTFYEVVFDYGNRSYNEMQKIGEKVDHQEVTLKRFLNRTI